MVVLLGVLAVVASGTFAGTIAVRQDVTVAVAVVLVPFDVTVAEFGSITQPVWVDGIVKVDEVGNVVVALTMPRSTGVPPLNASVTSAESPVIAGLPAVPSLKVNGAVAVAVTGVPAAVFHAIVAVFVWATLYVGWLAYEQT
jgi:hypothetical protein